MEEVATNKCLYLPYGMGLTRVFHAFGISLEDEAFKEILHIDTYDDWFLHRLGYQKVRGRWIKRGSGQEADPDSKDELRSTKNGPFQPTHDVDIEAGPSELALDADIDEEQPEQATPP